MRPSFTHILIYTAILGYPAMMIAEDGETGKQADLDQTGRQAASLLYLEPEDSTSRELKEVVVVAQEGGGITTSSRIDRSAMQHLQPTSFADVLELLPGNISQDPKLNAVNAISLRETGTLSATGARTDNDKYAITSLGTQFVIDGATVNTDANMQGITGIDAADPAARRSAMNRGVDMRTISTDNIESVEVVRGIPSAEYGNLTSGMVNIRRIKRATPFTFRFKADEYSKLFSASKGISLRRNKPSIDKPSSTGFQPVSIDQPSSTGSQPVSIDKPGSTSFEPVLNMDLSYLDSKTDPRNSLDNYKRLTACLMPTFRGYNETFGYNLSLGLDFTGSFDDAKVDPDLNFNKIDEYRSSYRRYAFTSDLNFSLYRVSWIDNVVANVAISYERDLIERHKQVAPQRASAAPSGYDEGEHNIGYLLGEYIADYKVDGRPFSADIKLKANGTLPFTGLDHRWKTGAEWSITKNYGDGQVYDLSRPLSASWTTRPRKFSEIPSMTLISGFVEDNIELAIGQNRLEVQLGVRAMSMPGLADCYRISGRVYLDPRVNCQWRFPVIDTGRPLRFTLAGGWGKTSRMPTMDYLYPQPHYNDVIQLNHYDPANPHEGSIVNVRTYRVDAANYDLDVATNRKWEVRVGASWGNNRLSITYFDERMANGYRYTPVYQSYAYRQYDATGIDPIHPSVDGLPYTDACILDGFNKVTNGTKILKRGVEYTLQTERYMPLGTSLIINGAWFRSTYSNSQALYSPVNDVVGSQAVSDLFVGIYETNDGRVNEQFNTNFMLDTQIPRWGLLFTTNIQCMWFVKTTRLSENGMPTAYIAAADGQIHDFTGESMIDPLLRYLVKTYNVDAFRTVKVPTAVYVNLKASKQIGQWLRLSAFVNRIIDYLPDYKSNGLTVRRSTDAYFGMEAVLTL